MSKLKLDHSLTSSKLAELNQLIINIVKEEDFNSENLLQLISQRELMISEQINSFPKDSDELVDFAKNEMEANNSLKEVIGDFFQDTQVKLKKLVKGRKALKKYS